MKMPLLKVKNYDPINQAGKITKEYDEYMLEHLGTDKDIEESLDLITAIFTKLTHENSKEKLEKAFKKHCNKLKLSNKLKLRGWETKGTIKIELEDEQYE